MSESEIPFMCERERMRCLSVTVTWKHVAKNFSETISNFKDGFDVEDNKIILQLQ